MSSEKAIQLLRDIREERIYVFDGMATMKAAIQDVQGEEVKLW